MMVRRVSIVLLCAAVLGAGACAPHAAGPVQGYDGPKRPSQEVVKLIVLSSLEVLAVDEKKIDLPYFSGKHYEMELLPGSRKLKVIYRETWTMPDASSELVVSDASLFQWNTRAGAAYLLKHDGPTRDQPVDDFTKLPNIWLVDPETGRRIEPTAMEKYGAPIVRMFRKSVMSDTTPAADAGRQPPEGTVGSASQAEDLVMQQDALKRLKFWWKAAGKDERQAFREGVGTESPSAGKVGSASQAKDIVMQQDNVKRLQFWWKMADENDRKAFREWMGTESP